MHPRPEALPASDVMELVAEDLREVFVTPEATAEAFSATTMVTTSSTGWPANRASSRPSGPRARIGTRAMHLIPRFEAARRPQKAAPRTSKK